MKLFLSIVLSLILMACSPSELPSKDASVGANPERSERPDHAVEVIVVERQSVSLSRTLTGTLEVPRTVHVHSEQPGRLVELPFYEGDKVAQGATLVRLDDALLRAGLAKVVALRKQAEVDLKRLQKLVSSNLTSQEALARAETALELAQAEELLQRTLLSRTVILAPFGGIISERLKEPGDVVAMNDHILTFFDPALMTAAIQVPEQLQSRVEVGDAVEVRIDSLGDRSFNAKILRIHPVIDAGTRQGTVEIRLDPVPKNARPGQLCRVTLTTAPTPRRLIPLIALQFDTSGSYVYRVNAESQAIQVPVNIGLQIGESIEIIDGVNDGDRVVARGFLGLKSGKKVRIVNPVDPVSASPESTAKQG